MRVTYISEKVERITAVDAWVTLIFFVVGITGVWVVSHSGWAVFWAIVAGCRVRS